jgi:hypothetical protein
VIYPATIVFAISRFDGVTEAVGVVYGVSSAGSDSNETLVEVYNKTLRT